MANDHFDPLFRLLSHPFIIITPCILHSLRNAQSINLAIAQPNSSKGIILKKSSATYCGAADINIYLWLSVCFAGAGMAMVSAIDWKKRAHARLSMDTGKLPPGTRRGTGSAQYGRDIHSARSCIQEGNGKDWFCRDMGIAIL